MRKILLQGFLFLLGLQANAQTTSFLHGQWEGTSHQMNRDGSTTVMTAAECVYGKLGGKIAVVEGRHFLGNGTLGFGTYGTLSPLDQFVSCTTVDSKKSNYRFSIYLNDGTTRLVCAKVDEASKEWVWFLELPKNGNSPAVTIRYTINITDKDWSEVGESSIDTTESKIWKPFFRMNLKKKSELCSGF